MSSDRYHRAKSIFLSVIDLEIEDRAAFLDDACAGDADLRSQVERILDAEHPSDVTKPLMSDESPAEWIGRYKLLQLIGEGGFGSVWMAEQREPVKRRVALKIIKLGMDTKQVIARFEAERQALALMDHPNIAKVLDAGATQTGRPYFVMEYIRGVPIIEYCDTEKLDTNARLQLFTQVCNAIQHAHQKGIIHRDIKPGNVLITLHDGLPVPKVIDFGIAKAINTELTSKTLFTTHRQMIGTPAYMSPEQAEMSGLDIDTRSDIYSLGVLLYELLTGTTPFDSDSLLKDGIAEMMRVIRDVEPQRPSTRLATLGDAALRTAERRRSDVKGLGMIIRGDLDWIVMKCLEKDRTRRFETANALVADIRRHLHDMPVDASPPSTSYRLRKFVKRNRGQVIAVCLLGAVLILGIIGTSIGMLWALDEKSRADAATLSERLAREEADRERDHAVDERKRADWNLYLANIRMADAAIATAGVRQARLSLEECDPQYRGWEWKWLSSRLDQSIAVLRGHDRSVRACSFGPDSATVLTGSWDKTARLWDSVSGEVLRVFEGHAGYVRSARFDKDGALVVTASEDGTARVWDVSNEEPVAILENHDVPFIDASFDQTSSRVLTTSEDGWARIWNLEGVDPPLELVPQDGGVVLAAFSPDGGSVLTVSTTSDLQLWNALTGEARSFSIVDNARVRTAAFDPSGSRIVAGFLDGAVRIIGVRTGEVLVELLGHSGEITASAFGPDGHLLLTTSVDKTSRVWNATDGTLITVLRGHTGSIRASLFSPDGSKVLTASADRTARVWDTHTGETLALLRGHEDDVWAAAFDSSGTRVVTGSLDKTARLWEPFDVASTPMLVGHTQPLTSADFDQRGSRVITTSLDKTVGIWSVATGEFLQLCDNHTGAVLSLAVSHDAARFATCSDDGTARLWESSSGRQLHVLREHGSSVTSVAFSPDDSQLMTINAEGAVRFWDVNSGAILDRSLVLDGGTTTASYSADGTLIATASADGSIGIFNALNGERIRFIQGHEEAATCVAFDPTGSRVVSASQDKTARVWDVATGSQVAELRGHEDYVLSAIYSADGERIITASRDDTVRLWDPEEKSEVVVIRGHEGAVASARFSRDGQYLVTASHDKTARIWSTWTYRKRCADVLEGDGPVVTLVNEAIGRTSGWTDAANDVRSRPEVDERTRQRALSLLRIRAEEARQKRP